MVKFARFAHWDARKRAPLNQKLCFTHQEYAVTFEHWMRLRGLSESSIKKYEGAISGAMSEWAINSGLLDGPITSINSNIKFEAIATRLRNLEIYQERNNRGHNMYNSALNKYADFLMEGFDSDIDADIEDIFLQKNIPNTEKIQLLKARVGQGRFRQKLIALWGGCSVTGYRDFPLLIASHIKPWSASSNQERLDGYNGLLLLPNIDKAFDSGFISFDGAGRILISPLLQGAEILGINSSFTISMKPENQKYMEFHRSSVFRET